MAEPTAEQFIVVGDTTRYDLTSVPFVFDTWAGVTKWAREREITGILTPKLLDGLRVYHVMRGGEWEDPRAWTTVPWGTYAQACVIAAQRPAKL